MITSATASTDSKEQTVELRRILATQANARTAVNAGWAPVSPNTPVTVTTDTTGTTARNRRPIRVTAIRA